MGRRNRNHKPTRRAISSPSRRLPNVASVKSHFFPTSRLIAQPLKLEGPVNPRAFARPEGFRVYGLRQFNTNQAREVRFNQPFNNELVKQFQVCTQRRERREVIHALGKAGKVGQKRPRFTENSKITCKV